MTSMTLASIPGSVRNGIIFLVAGWISLLAALYQFEIQEYFTRFLIAGVLVCFFMIRLKSWARMLCLLSNAMAVIYFGMFSAIFFYSGSQPLTAGISLLTALLFGLSSYFLLRKPTRIFFKDRQRELYGNGAAQPDESSKG
jgi:hypothetical protein